MNEIMNKYPVLKDGYQLYQGANISYIRSLRTSTKNSSKYRINESSVDIIKECNGINSFKEVINNLTLIYNLDYNEIKKIVFSFIEDNPIFKISDIKLKSPYIPIKGSCDLQIPMMFSIELTNYCNYSCEHCYNNSKPENNEFIDSNKLIEFLSYIKEFDPVIELTGGEPLSHPDIEKIIDYCCKNFETVNVITNGSLVKKHVEFLSRYSDLVLSISLYSYKSEYMDWFTNTKGYFDIVISNIKELVKKGIHVVGTLLVTPANVKDLYPTVKMIKTIGADSFRTGIIMPIGRAKNKDLDFTLENIDEFNVETEKVDKDFSDFMVKIPEYLLEKRLDRINCGITIDSISIKYNGDVRICAMIPDNFNIGNILNGSPESFFRKLAKYPYYKIPEPKKEICGDCEHITFCEGCIARGLCAQEDKAECIWYNNIFKPMQNHAEKNKTINY
ncbi:MAG: radical SAM protein [Methanobrevibacter sp.]|nr:radical SAM protein [Candidatus Methanovirga procula]